MNTVPKNIRERFERALAGEVVKHPVCAVSAWFVKNRPAVDWESSLNLRLGQVNHANFIKHERPNFKPIETTSEHDGQARRDICLVIDRGGCYGWEKTPKTGEFVR